jgi:hypothetical protein
MNACCVSSPQYKYQLHAQPAPHLANFCHSRALGLQLRQCPKHTANAQSMPPPTEHALDRLAPGACRRLDRFTLNIARSLYRRPRSLHPEHALDRFTPGACRRLDRFTLNIARSLCRQPRSLHPEHAAASDPRACRRS